MCCGWLSWLAGVSLFKAPCRCTQAPCQQVRSHENHIPNPICPRSYKTSDSRNARKTFAKKKILSRSPSRSFRGGSWMVPNGRPLHIVKQGPLDQLSCLVGCLCSGASKRKPKGKPNSIPDGLSRSPLRSACACKGSQLRNRASVFGVFFGSAEPCPSFAIGLKRQGERAIAWCLAWLQGPLCL